MYGSFPELGAEYWFKKVKEFSNYPYFFKAARMSLANCIHSEDFGDLPLSQRQEAREAFDKMKKIQTKV